MSKILNSASTIGSKYFYYQIAKKAYWNQTRTWRRPTELLADNPQSKIGLRYTKGQGGQFYIFDSADKAICKYYELLQYNHPDDYVFSEGVPDKLTLVQGEVQQSTLFPPYQLTFSTKREVTIRDVLKLPHRFLEDLPNEELSENFLYHAYGLTALHLLRSRMSPSSFTDLEAMFENFPDHVVEFSTFEINVGILKGRNTVFWECRKY